MFYCLLSLSVIVGSGVFWNFHSRKEGIQPYLFGADLCYKRAYWLTESLVEFRSVTTLIKQCRESAFFWWY
jgi:hypothetical protein